MTPSERWQQRTEWPLIGIALAFLVAYAVPIVQPSVSARVVHLCDVVVVVSWLLFAADYLIRLVLAERKWRFVRSNIVDLAVIALPLLRPLRLLRLIALLSVINRSAANNLRGRVVVYVTGGALLMLLCARLAVTAEERNVPDANILDFGDGIWWAITTMTTVGYGDHYPVTTTGRFVAAALMVGGIALLGVITATLASWMVERVREGNDADQAATRSQIDQLTARIEDLHRELREQRPAPVGVEADVAAGPGHAPR
ncbi:potassium channel family protein [Nakamurella flavida]|uniref:Potassium channel family protein n=1 Tax=Nakamurella flavida TaxID=363630 RepID=A0A938YIF5_9ACTN|nr:potassium channel family protein [Nakamurella flavida]MBM9478281.1 potassium channel family protein [Nakamurella flavida]MDP9777548.1 voltage-gated potassium channel [Nakamurella flavida]